MVRFFVAKDRVRDDRVDGTTTQTGRDLEPPFLPARLPLHPLPSCSRGLWARLLERAREGNAVDAEQAAEGGGAGRSLHPPFPFFLQVTFEQPCSI